MMFTYLCHQSSVRALQCMEGARGMRMLPIRGFYPLNVKNES